MNHYSISFLALFSGFFLSPALSLYEDALERVHFPPRAREIQFTTLSGLDTLNYANVMEVYARVLECNQMVGFLKNEMSKRLNESVPPPHQHCFISERNLTQLHPNNHNTTLALRCDQRMLSRFPSALQRAAIYEGQHFRNQETNTIFQVKGMLENIQLALSNFTSLILNGTAEMEEGRDVDECGDLYLVSSEAGQEERSGQQARRGSGSFTPPSESSGQEERSGNQRQRSPNLQPVDPTDINFYLRFQPPESTREDATPTATTPTRCTEIENDSDQFIYITELWLSLYYLRLDLQQQRNCLLV